MAKKAMARKKTLRIDLHSHVVPAEMLRALERNPARYRMRFEGEGDKRRLIREGGITSPVFKEHYDPEAKVAGMDRKGLDVSVVSTAPTVFFYWLDADIALEASRILNDGIAKMVAAKPDRLMGMGTIPMQNPDAAIAELERIVREHGFRAVELGTSVEDEQLAHPRFRPVLRRIQELKVFVFAHPYSTTPECGLEHYHLRNLIGNPLHTTIMAGNLMFSGALDELKDLRILLAHGGGYVPYQIGRFAHGHKVRQDTAERTRTSPYRFLRRFYYDALTHDPRALRYLIDMVGANRVTIGTDAPFDMGEERPIRLIGKVKGLKPAQRDQIYCRTAMHLLGKKAVPAPRQG